MNALCSLKSPYGQIQSAMGEVLLAQNVYHQKVSVTEQDCDEARLQAGGTELLASNPGLEGMGHVLGRIPPL